MMSAHRAGKDCQIARQPKEGKGLGARFVLNIGSDQDPLYSSTSTSQVSAFVYACVFQACIYVCVCNETVFVRECDSDMIMYVFVCMYICVCICA